LELDCYEDLAAPFAHGQGANNPLSMTRDGTDYFYRLDHQGSGRLLTTTTPAALNDRFCPPELSPSRNLGDFPIMSPTCG